MIGWLAGWLALVLREVITAPAVCYGQAYASSVLRTSHFPCWSVFADLSLLMTLECPETLTGGP